MGDSANRRRCAESAGVECMVVQLEAARQSGNKNAFRHGRYTAEAIARRRQLSELIRATRTTLAKIEEQR